MKVKIIIAVMKIKEIFYSLQGEGLQFGKPVIFIRLSGCNKRCWYCDTDFTKGTELNNDEIYDIIKDYKSKYIIWTGGEPTLQLTNEDVSYFNNLHYKQGIETNGTNGVPYGLDYITCSPKVDTDTLNKNFNYIDEIRYAIGINETPPDIDYLPFAGTYYVSPLFIGEEHKRLDLCKDNLEWCIEFVKNNPDWRLSLQQQKIINIK